MSYSTTYVDENNLTREISVSEDESREALKNDFEELMKIYNKKMVDISRQPTKPGEALRLRVTVFAPSHYLADEKDVMPKPCGSMSVDVVCYPGYPIVGVKAIYNREKRLASPNVFRSGAACIDSWISFTSSIITTVDKLVHDIIHDPLVTRYDSPACPNLIEWHKKGVLCGIYPTVSPKSLYVSETPLPPRRNIQKVSTTLPPLPKRIH